jgi:hypothetical protein
MDVDCARQYLQKAIRRHLQELDKGEATGVASAGVHIDIC